MHSWLASSILCCHTMVMKTLTITKRTLNEADTAKIQATVTANWACGRTEISRILCRISGWVPPNDRLKDMACREIFKAQGGFPLLCVLTVQFSVILLSRTSSLSLLIWPLPSPLTSQPSSKYRQILRSSSIPKQSMMAAGRPVISTTSSGSRDR